MTNKVTKIKHLKFDGLKLFVDVKTQSKTETREYKGLLPETVLYPDYLRVGCLRISLEAAKKLVQLMESGQQGLVQAGSYKSKDPDDSTYWENKNG